MLKTIVNWVPRIQSIANLYREGIVQIEIVETDSNLRRTGRPNDHSSFLLLLCLALSSSALGNNFGMRTNFFLPSNLKPAFQPRVFVNAKVMVDDSAEQIGNYNLVLGRVGTTKDIDNRGFSPWSLSSRASAL